MAGGGALTYVGWMAAFTETIETQQPRGDVDLARPLRGWIMRIVVSAFFSRYCPSLCIPRPRWSTRVIAWSRSSRRTPTR